MQLDTDIEKLFFPALILFQQANCIERIFFFIYNATDQNIAFSSTPVICYLLSFGNLVVNPVHFLLTENIKRGNQEIILLFNSKYKRQWFNVIFLQGINAVS